MSVDPRMPASKARKELAEAIKAWYDVDMEHVVAMQCYETEGYSPRDRLSRACTALKSASKMNMRLYNAIHQAYASGLSERQVWNVFQKSD